MIPRLALLGLVALLLAPAGCGEDKPSTTDVEKPPQPPKPPEEVLDHFLCYEVMEKDFEFPVTLKDQFKQTPVDHTIKARELLCNPATKNEAKPRNPAAHLLCYRIDAQASGAPVKVVGNQFGQGQKLAPRKSSFLCVPTGKKTTNNPEKPKIPAGLDHFKCYDVKGPVIETDEKVQDQFFPDPIELGNVTASQLCNPVEKSVITARGGTTHINHAAAHLVCYRRLAFMGAGDAYKIKNQLETLSLLTITRLDSICLPSTKSG